MRDRIIHSKTRGFPTSKKEGKKLQISMNITGEEIYKFASEIFPIHRSITGEGTRETLRCLKKIVPEMEIMEVPSGTQVFDWVVPREWECRDAFLENSKGEKIVSIKDNNLHVMGYSAPLDVTLKKNLLKEKYIHTIPEKPEAIPYVTSYYKERAGFCLSEKEWNSLPDGEYRLFIDSNFREDGALSYGQIVIPGETEEEILFSTYICHPQMANNEISGPSVAIHLAKYVKSLSNRRFTYRFVFVPETIGVITYLSRNLQKLQKNLFAGFNITCIGDERDYSHVCSRYGNNRADIVVEKLLAEIAPDHKTYSFMERGSDEREYCAPGIDLPVCTLCRTKFHVYPEYHTSLDDMTVISEKGLYDSFKWLTDICRELESNTAEYESIVQTNPYESKAVGKRYKTLVLGEPQLGKRNLYNTLSKNIPYGGSKELLDVYFYCDGKNDAGTISEITGYDIALVDEILARLCSEKLIEEVF